MVSTFDFHWNDLLRIGKFAYFFRISSNTKPQKRERVNCNWFTSGIHCASLIKSTVIILNGQKENGMVPTTNRTYPWLYVIHILCNGFTKSNNIPDPILLVIQFECSIFMSYIITIKYIKTVYI